MVESTNNIEKIPLSFDEEKALDLLTQTLKLKKVQYDENKYSNNHLIRFLRARKYNIEKTIQMFIKFLKWNQEIQVEEITKLTFNEMPKVKVLYPRFLHKTDKLGRPIYIELIGQIDLKQLLKVTNLERLQKMNIQHQENIINNVLPACSAESGKNIHQTLTIIDLKRFSKKLLSKKLYNYLKVSFSNLQNYYPETLGNLIIINSSIIFKACWTVIKPFLDDKTKKKILFCGRDYKKKLLEYVMLTILFLLFLG